MEAPTFVSLLLLTSAGLPATAITPYSACDIVASKASASMFPGDLRRCTATCTLAMIKDRVETRTAPTDFEQHPLGAGGWGRNRERPFSVYKQDVPQDQNMPVRGYDSGRMNCAMEHTLAEHDPDLKHRTYYPSAAALWDSVPMSPPPKRCFRRVLKKDIRPCSENQWLQCTHEECETVAAECDTDWVKRAPYSDDFAQTVKKLEDLKQRGLNITTVAADADRALECGVTGGDWAALLREKDGAFKGWGSDWQLPCMVSGCEVRRQCMQLARAIARAAYPETLTARDVAQAAAGHPHAAPSVPEDLLYENTLARQFWSRADIPGAVAVAKQIQDRYALEIFVTSRLLWREGVSDTSPWSKIC